MIHGLDADDARLERVIVLVNVLDELELRRPGANDQDLLCVAQRLRDVVEVVLRLGRVPVLVESLGVVVQVVLRRVDVPLLERLGVEMEDLGFFVVQPDGGMSNGHRADSESTARARPERRRSAQTRRAGRARRAGGREIRARRFVGTTDKAGASRLALSMLGRIAMSKKPEETADKAEENLHKKEHRGQLATEASVAAGGAALGAMMGAIAGPPGMVAGAVVGGVVGAVAGLGLEREIQHEDAVDRSITATGEEADKEIESRHFARKSGTPPPPAPKDE